MPLACWMHLLPICLLPCTMAPPACREGIEMPAQLDELLVGVDTSAGSGPLIAGEVGDVAADEGEGAVVWMNQTSRPRATRGDDNVATSCCCWVACHQQAAELLADGVGLAEGGALGTLIISHHWLSAASIRMGCCRMKSLSVSAGCPFRATSPASVRGTPQLSEWRLLPTMTARLLTRVTSAWLS